MIMMMILILMMMVLLIVIVKWPAGTHNCLACQIILSLREEDGEIKHAVILCVTRNCLACHILPDHTESERGGG